MKHHPRAEISVLFFSIFFNRHFNTGRGEEKRGEKQSEGKEKNARREAMEEIEKLRAKVVASMSASTNPNFKVNKEPLKSKEEGELSSSADRDEEVHTSSAGQSTSTTPSLMDLNVIPPSKHTQNPEKGKHVSLNGPANSGDIQLKTTVKPKYSKPFDINSVSSKSGIHRNPGWCTPPVANNNLVIRFSDDESESDSEDYNIKRTPDRKKSTSELCSYSRPPTSMHLKSDYLQRNVNNQLKTMPRKVSPSRTFISSMTKIHGANYKGSRSSVVDRVPQTKSSDPLHMKSSVQERGYSQALISDNSKMESLRQKIAFRENQLKLQLKPAQQRQTKNSGSYQDNSVMRLKNNATVKNKSSFVNGVEEQDKKRLKLEQPNQNRPSFDVQKNLDRYTAESLSKSKMTVLGSNGLDDGNLVNCNQSTKGISVATTETIVDKQQDKFGKQIPVPPGNILIGVQDGVSFTETMSSTALNTELSKRQGSGRTPVTDIITNFNQSWKGMKLLDSSIVLNQNSQLAQMKSRVIDEDSSKIKMPSPKKITTEVLRHPIAALGHHSGSSSQNGVLSLQNSTRKVECNQVTHGDRIFNPSSNNTFDKCPVNHLVSGKCPVNDPGSKFATSNESDINTSLLNSLDPPKFSNISGQNSMDIQTLVEMEELQDKELEEAQDHRHRCEVEERNALKAYREAQRALVEANARCTHLYRRREVFSAQRAFILEESSSLRSSRCHKHTEARLNSLGNVLETYKDQFPTSSHQMQAPFEVLNQLGHDSNIQCTEGALLHLPYRCTDGVSLASEPCCAPDASQSELLHDKDNVAAVICVPSSYHNISVDGGGDVLPTDIKSVHSRPMLENEEILEKSDMGINGESEEKSTSNSAQDYALLEASLRSELFARLGTKTIPKNSGLRVSGEHAVGQGADCLVRSNKSHMGTGNLSLVVAEQNLIKVSGGDDRTQVGQVHNQGDGNKGSVEYRSCRIPDPEDCRSSLTEACRSTAFVSFLPPSVFRTAFSHVNDTSQKISRGLQTGTQEKCMYDVSHEEDSGPKCYSSLLDSSGVCMGQDFVRAIDAQELGSNTCDLSIDPLWPLCMFEVRGKCNDENCLAQHVKDYSGKNVKRRVDSTSDSEVGTSCHLVECIGERKLPRSLQQNIMPPPPTYLVGPDVLRDDVLSSGTVLARAIGPYWLNDFSNSLTINFSIRRNLLTDVPMLHDSEGSIILRGSWSRRSLYLRSQDGVMNHLKQDFADPQQALDLALVHFNEEAEGKEKALSVLSRALESYPTSVVLWVVYLRIFYRNVDAAKDDMASLAIQNNDGSYEIWLMYINSRVHYNARLVAYDFSLLALHRHASAPDKDKVHASACILDLFLQMMDFLCMSGDTAKAIQRIYGLLTDTNVADRSSVLLSDILPCLTVFDKGIFWVCCVYLVIYRKLPDVVVQQFEFEKDLPFEIEWPSVHLTADEKHRALRLLEIGVDSVALDINCDSHESGIASRSAQLLAVCHVHCVALLEGLENCMILLNKYIKQYPACLELVVTLARLHKKCSGDLGFEGFENALHNWPRGIPGIQCVWNQYVQFVLERGESELAKQLMLRWFETVWEVCSPQTGKLGGGEYEGICDSSESLSSSKLDAFFSSSKSKDELFGLLNLTLHKLLQKDQVEARLVIDNALKVASPEDFKYCLREHVLFVSSTGSVLMEDTPGGGILRLLDSYLLDSRFLLVPELLSRKFYGQIKKPRTRQLISKMFGSVSSDCSLLNSVLEAWYGPSLLPEKFDKLNDFVDHVEALIGIFPANYRLALSVCELIARYCKSEGIASAGVVFWASSLLVNSIGQVVPVAPEEAWVEASGALSNLVEIQVISERFHRQALLVYPLSVKLWKSYVDLSKTIGRGEAVLKAAKARGIKLD